jgi:PEP-CTERM motif
MKLLQSFFWSCAPGRGLLRPATIVALVVGTASQAWAVIGFDSSPATNSSDWSTYVTLAGMSINSNVNFNTHPSGALQPNFYLGSDGVTLNAVGFQNVATGAGAPSGTLTPPLSSGEGPLGTASYLEMAATTLTVSFATPVLGVGFYTADLYNPAGDNPLILSLYSGPNATGTLLGQYFAPAFNFQLNNIYFIGAADTASTIGSAVLVSQGFHGDGIELDKVVFTQVPEPSALALAAFGLTAFLGFGRRRRNVSPRHEPRASAGS